MSLVYNNKNNNNNIYFSDYLLPLQRGNELCFNGTFVPR